MGKKKLNYVDKGINTSILAIITVILGIITIIAIATNYIVGVFVTVIFMVFVAQLLKGLNLEELINSYIKGRKW